MIYFDSDMSNSTNTVVYFDWKTVIYIYVCGKCRSQFILPMEKSVTFNGTCANEIIQSVNRSFVYKAKEGRYVRMYITSNLPCYLLTLVYKGMTWPRSYVRWDNIYQCNHSRPPQAMVSLITAVERCT
jgi:hypothetical protein